MTRTNFTLRLHPSLLEEARSVAAEEGATVDRLISVAVAEKLSALRTEADFRESASRWDIGKVREVLGRAENGNPPVSGDDLTSLSTTDKATEVG